MLATLRASISIAQRSLRVLLRLTVVVVVLSLLPVAAAGADTGSSVGADAAQSQYGGTPP